jgi:predicted nucleotidyltransferase
MPGYEPEPDPHRHLEPEFSIRSALLEEALRFTRAARDLDGVSRIALVGSLVTDKQRPKDCDLLVTVDRSMALNRLAGFARRLKGRTGSLGSGADVFLCEDDARYIGRICEWKECWPRVRCDALHCGRRPHLHDDLQVITLSREAIATPPVELWPEPKVRTEVPIDVEELLIGPLRADRSQV